MKRHYIQNEDADYRLGENICNACNWQKVGISTPIN